MEILDNEQVTSDISFNHRNKLLQCYDRSKKFFDQPVKNDLRTYENDLRTYDDIRKVATAQGDDYPTG